MANNNNKPKPAPAAATFRKGEVTIDGCHFNDEKVRQMTEEEFVAANAHQWPRKGPKEREDLLISAYKACKEAE